MILESPHGHFVISLRAFRELFKFFTFAIPCNQVTDRTGRICGRRGGAAPVNFSPKSSWGRFGIWKPNPPAFSVSAATGIPIVVSIDLAVRLTDGGLLYALR